MKIRKVYPSLVEDVEKKIRATTDVAAANALENSEINKEASDKAKEEAEKKAKEFVKDEKTLENNKLNESIEDGEWRPSSKEEHLLDDCFGYLRDLKGDKEFARFALDILGMSPVDLKLYCDIDVEDLEESLKEEINEKEHSVDEFLKVWLDFKKRAPGISDYAYIDLPDKGQDGYIIVKISDDIDLDRVYDFFDEYDIIDDIEETPTEIRAHVTVTNREQKTSIDLYDRIMRDLTYTGTLKTGASGKPTSNYGAGYNHLSQIGGGVDETGKGKIIVRVSPQHEEEDRKYLNSLEPAKEVAKKYADYGVKFEETKETISTDPEIADSVLTIYNIPDVKV